VAESKIYGFLPGIVRVNDDDRILGRVKAEVPGLIEPWTHYWIKPAGWPGAGGANHQGSQYPSPPLGSQIYILWENGIWDDPESSAIYLTGFYGVNEDGVSAGPTSVRSAKTAEEARRRCCLYETDWMDIVVIDDDNDKRLLIQTKARGSDGELYSRSFIEISPTAGGSGKAEQIIIHAATALVLKCPGLLDIDAGRLQLQGRPVIKGGGTI
jgi:hypothetical protein